MRNLRVSVVNTSSLFSFREISPGKYEPIEGIEYNLFKVFAEFLRFSFDIVTPSEKVWGYQKKDGSWNGMLGMVARNEADIAVEFLTVTEERSRVVDFSFPYVIDRVALALRTAPLISKEVVLIKPFTPMVWALLGVSMILSAATLLGIYIIDNDFVRDKTCGDYLHKFLYVFLQRDGIFSSMRKPSRRIFIAIVLIHGTILTLSYSAILLSFLTIPLRESQISTIQELIQALQDGKIHYAVKTGSSVYEFIMTSKDENMIKLKEYIQKHPENEYGGHFRNCIPFIVDKNAAVFEPSIVFKIASHELGVMKETYLSSHSVALMPTGVAFRKNFCCRDSFNKLILRVIESGLYEKWVSDVTLKLQLKAPSRKEEDLIRPLGLKDIIGAFYFLLFSYSFAIIAFIYEKANYISSRRLPNHVPPWLKSISK